MSAVREIVLRRAKEAAKIVPLEAGCAVPVAAPNIVQHDANETSGEGNRIPITQSTPLKPPALRKPPVPGGADSSRGHGPLSNSERRRPRPTSEPGQGNERAASVGRRQQAGSDVGPRSASLPRKPALEKVRIGDAPPELDKKDVGKVPAYLKKRNVEMAEAKRKAALPPEPTCPPGYRKVSESEKEESLKVLRCRKNEAEKAQAKLPFSIETPGQKKREQELKDRIQHLEKLIGMFNKETVFLPVDAEPIAKSFPVEVEEKPHVSALGAFPQEPMSKVPAPRPQNGYSGQDAPWARDDRDTIANGRPSPYRSNISQARSEMASIIQHEQAPSRSCVNILAPPGGKSSLSLSWD
jgi:hypothetical protein